MCPTAKVYTTPTPSVHHICPAYIRGRVQLRCSTNFSDKKHLHEAVESLDTLVQQGSLLDNSIFYGILRGCIAHKDLWLGSRVHFLAVKNGYESDSFLANHIIRMYAAHCKLEEAMQVFSKVAAPNHYTWAAIILAHARHGQPGQAVCLYKQMRASSVKPDNHVFVAVLKACATAKDVSAGRQVHADVVETGDRVNVLVRNCLVDMYAKCGSLEDARRVFDTVPCRDLVTWNAMIAGYAQHGLGREALSLYCMMQQESLLTADAVTFVCLLQACATTSSLVEGKQLHAQICEKGLEADILVGNSLVNMYAKCGSLGDARQVFENLPTKDVVTWNGMIAGYARSGLGQEALCLYDSMQHEGTIPADAVTFVSLLQACGSEEALEKGKQIHAQILQLGLLATNLFVANALIDMYSKCGSLEDAQLVFDSLMHKDVVTWTAIIGGFAQHGLREAALSYYERMKQQGIFPTCPVTYVSLLQAFASLKALHEGRQIHAQIQERGLEADPVVATSLVDMYAKCGSLDDAWRIFSNLPTKSVVTWTAMIGGYPQEGLAHKALALHRNMRADGIIAANPATFISLLQACACAAALDSGKKIHLEIMQCGLDANDLSVANTLIDMYCKCGSTVDAQRVFDALYSKNVVTWNALIAGYARQGQSEDVFQLFHAMKQEGIQPDSTTFLSVLTVCNHVGLLDDAQEYFQAMSRDFGIPATIQHYTCVVDLLGRAGQVHKAVQMVKMMPLPADGVVWNCVLAACQKWK